MRVAALCLAAVVAGQCALGTSAAVATVWKSTAVRDEVHGVPVAAHRVPEEKQQGADRTTPVPSALDAQAQGTRGSLFFFLYLTDSPLDGNARSSFCLPFQN